MFRPKEPTEQELVSDMQRMGISTKSSSGRQEKFGAFKDYAIDRQSRKPGFAPVNPYANMSHQDGNPYAQNDATNGEPAADSGNPHSGNPYSSNLNSDHSGTANPYSSGNSSSPYTSGNSSTPYKSGNSSSPYTSGSSRNPYASSSSRNPYASERPGSTPDGHASRGHTGAANAHATSGGRAQSGSAGGANPYKTTQGYNGRRPAGDDELVLDLNAIPSELPPLQLKRPVRHDTETLDLNAVSDEEDLNVGDDFLPEEEQVNLEDEEVEAIKQDIRFVKQESIQLTRNTLAHAMQADALGTNTLGVLGSQSERLFNAEQNLLLGETQTRIADEKVKELRRLNRSIFIPASGNPFNKKLRLRQQEANLKTQKEQEKYLRESNRLGMYASEQRVKEGLTSKATSSDTYNKYQGERQLQQAQRYQFENDSEDDEMEKELASNLDQIASYTKKLRNTANLMGKEVDAQNDRLRKIEEDADRLDINVHLNTTRLHNIR